MRSFSDGARLVSRSLPEIRDVADDVLLRIRRAYKQETRVGEEPLSLTTLVNSVMLWFIHQEPELQDSIVVPAAKELDRLMGLDGPEPIKPGSVPLGDGDGGREWVHAYGTAGGELKDVNPEGKDKPPKRGRAPKRRT